LLVAREGGEVVSGRLSLFRLRARGTGVAPRPKGWIAAAASAFRPRTGARRVEEWLGYDAAAYFISQSVTVAGGDGDAGCKYISVKSAGSWCVMRGG
jgi:hypothetical protein